jgi:uncharacterized damage-inducible protein DinB
MTGEQAQAVRDLFATVLEGEGPKTARVIAAVPQERRDYKPDPKSRSAWELATHLAVADIWFLDSIVNGAFTRPEGSSLPAGMVDPPSAAEWYTTHLKTRLETLRNMTAEELLRPTTFFRGTEPAVFWLTVMNNHSVHHRGQLCAYLRAAGSKVPAIFGVSADENPFAQGKPEE